MNHYEYSARQHKAQETSYTQLIELSVYIDIKDGDVDVLADEDGNVDDEFIICDTRGCKSARLCALSDWTI